MYDLSRVIMTNWSIGRIYHEAWWRPAVTLTMTGLSVAFVDSHISPLPDRRGVFGLWYRARLTAFLDWAVILFQICWPSTRIINIELAFKN